MVVSQSFAFARRLPGAVPVLLASAASGLYAGPVVSETPRRIPVVVEADVVVTGGASAGVAAALAAAEAGARVFVAAPFPYLGEDMCGPLRLWLEPGESPDTPLARALFADPRLRRGLTFAYAADLPSAGKHVDTTPPGMLTDGQWGTAYTQSVQYDGDVTITAELEQATDLGEVRIMYFQGPGSFEVDTFVVEAMDNAGTWRECARVQNPERGRGSWVESPLTVSAPLNVRTRRLRFHVSRSAAASRLLLGEIQLHARREPSEQETRALVIPPMQVKRVLEEALLEAGVDFLYGCMATEMLWDSAGEPAGVEVVTRAGRHAVSAKVVIDATERAWLTRSTGARFRPYPSEPSPFLRIVGGGEPCSGTGLTHRSVPLAYPIGGMRPAQYGTGGFGRTIQTVNAAMLRQYPELIVYQLRVPGVDGSFASLARAEQEARDRTYHADALVRPDAIWQVPPDPVYGRVSLTGPWPGAAAADLDAFRPAGTSRFYVLGPCGDVSRESAARLSRPLEGMRLGTRIGKAAAREANAAPPPRESRLAPGEGRPLVPGDTRETSGGLRPGDRPTRWVEVQGRAAPVVGEYDVVVAGGGTSGAPAAIGAARQGARTLVVEALSDLGGVGTVGMIGVYCAGYRKGFTAEVEAGVASLRSASYVDGKAEWWRREIRRAGGEIWFGALACGAFVDGSRVRGILVATPEGRGVVLARTVVDATGNGDVAIAAGAQPLYVGAETVAMQGTGLPQKELGASYINTDWTYVDETDMVDVRTAFVAAKRRYPGAWDLGQLIDTRERRRVLGDIVLSPLDIVNRRTFPDTVGISQGGRLDSHGYTIHPYYLINNHLGGIAHTPYRCLLPKGLDGILVVGLALSAHRDAIPSLRMQPCLQNLGYAAGCAAAMAARNGGDTRGVDVRALQRHLIETECLTPEIVSHGDSYPLPEEAVREAVRQLAETDYSRLGVLLASWDRAAPMLREAYRAAAQPGCRLRCAHVLGIMGDPTGFGTLAEVVSGTTEYDAENIGDYFPCITWLDSYLIALGRTRDRRALPIMLEKLDGLGQGNGERFSHYRAVCEALEQLGDPAAAEPLGRLLVRCGRAEATVTPEQPERLPSRNRNGVRNLILARVLYRCGDWEGEGRKVLEAYARDVRGVYARHAAAVLSRPPGAPTRPEDWLGL
ncbi:MAG: FAD-dependent oxidoreductase [Lentisphaeria bacterium]|nr:FAD-dependent oxidoreductase [Lentisphaeria bacterium]